MLLSLSLLVLPVLSAAQTISGPEDCLQAGNYQLCQNLWGRDTGVGSQSSTLVSQSDTTNSLSWSTTWNWTNGPDNVKSYANIESTVAKGVQLQNVTSAPTTWTWSYQSRSDGIRANVAYDIWTGVPSVGTPASQNSSYEIMIWLSSLGGIEPIGDSPVTTNVSLAGYTWDIWRGPNQNWEVLSFVVKDVADVTNFNVDLNEFFEYLIANQVVAPTQYIQSIQAGTEAFTGSAVLVTSNYSVAVNPN
ncbi:endocellulase [Marasmius fiardii PR-910]|nr:endocellulase [Marasmius fiardii PR-910]